MHEMAIAMQIVEQSLAAARRHGATGIDEVEVEIGMMRQVVPEALQAAFQAAAADTLAEGAELRISTKPISAECGNCRFVFAPGPDNFLCPRCGQADARIIAGDEIILQALYCRTPEDAETP